MPATTDAGRLRGALRHGSSMLFTGVFGGIAYAIASAWSGAITNACDEGITYLRCKRAADRQRCRAENLVWVQFVSALAVSAVLVLVALGLVVVADATKARVGE